MIPDGAATSLLAATLALVAGLLALALGMTARARRATRDLGRDLEALRRHPMVGPSPGAGHPSLRAIAQEIALLVDAFRDHVGRAQERVSALQTLADGPDDVAIVGLDAEWLVQSFSRGAARLLGWSPEEMAGRHVEVLFADGEWERILPKLARRSVREE